MGYGDEIMVTALARRLRLQKGDGLPVRIVDRNGSARRNIMWDGNPDITQGVGKAAHNLLNAPGHRHYIESKRWDKWTWKPWDASPGFIYLNDREEELAAQYAGKIIVMPHIKALASPNKAWGWIAWTRLVRMAGEKGIALTQLGTSSEALLMGAHSITTSSFRDACAILSRARAAVLLEGGLHHAAAAFNVPAVVLFGGFISPDITGYSMHTNLFTGGAACGSRQACDHCKAAMKAITPELVLDKLEALL